MHAAEALDQVPRGASAAWEATWYGVHWWYQGPLPGAGITVVGRRWRKGPPPYLRTAARQTASSIRMPSCHALAIWCMQVHQTCMMSLRLGTHCTQRNTLRVLRTNPSHACRHLGTTPKGQPADMGKGAQPANPGCLSCRRN